MLLPSWMSWQTPGIRKLGRDGKMEKQPDPVLLVFNQESNKAVIFFRDLCIQLCFIFSFYLYCCSLFDDIETKCKPQLKQCRALVSALFIKPGFQHQRATWSLWWGSLLLKKGTLRKEVVWGSHVTTNVFSKTFRSFRKAWSVARVITMGWPHKQAV